ncbi:retropepsin-like aspartic protease family protein [Aurantiacibacter flavus]|uniref:TIGR02281 family clan AA aspartic protease n=1 Tax=Aurantiacibacter flavus TaxID=3145232 RepID=A0ABV0CT61_9SPHN
MDWSALSEQIALSVRELPRSGLLMAAVGAMVLGIAGSLVRRGLPAFARLLRTISTLTLMGVLVLVVVQLSRLDPRFSMAVPEIGLPEQVVEGNETRVPLAPDGHYWLRAQINGHEASFLVDTGATLTAISQDTAERAGLSPRDGALPIRMQTANGAVAAHITSIAELRFGNVAARGLDAIIAPGLGETNVIGMNLLSRLASVRIEEGELVLVPNNPQVPVE